VLHVTECQWEAQTSPLRKARVTVNTDVLTPQAAGEVVYRAQSSVKQADTGLVPWEQCGGERGRSKEV